MTEKVEKEIVPAIREFDNTRTLITNIKNPLVPNQVFEILFPVPQVADGCDVADAECQERYGCSLQDLVNQGVRQLSTRPDYLQSGFIGELEGKKFVALEQKADAHEQMQELADNYQVGRKAALGESQKAKAAKLDAVNAKLAAAGVDNIDDLLARAQEMGLY